MRRLVIAVDCDDVLVSTTPFFIDSYNQKYGTKVTLADAHSLTDEVWGGDVDVETILARLNAFMDTEPYRELGTSLEEAEILRELHRYHDLHVVTARKEEERAVTAAMIERDVPGVFTSIDLVGWEGSKGVVCKRIKADVLIDDSARHLIDALEHGLPAGGAILFGAYPWNESDRNREGITYCEDWAAVKIAIERIAEKQE